MLDRTFLPVAGIFGRSFQCMPFKGIALVDFISYEVASRGYQQAEEDLSAAVLPVIREPRFPPVILFRRLAGFPSPAEDVREKLDLVKLLVRHTSSTFFFKVDGVSMVDAMDEGDIIIVDRAVDPYNNCKAICFIDGEFTV